MLYPYPGYCGTGLTELKEAPGTFMKSYKTSRSSRFGYESLTKLPELTGMYCGTGVHNFQKFRAGINMLYPYPGSLWHRCTEVPEVPGTGMSVLHHL